jgi:restriction endonuclease S subunit
MSRWATGKLGDVCRVRRGTTITQKQVTPGEVPVVGGGIVPTYYHDTPNRPAGTITISGSGASAGYVNRYSVPIFASDCSTVETRDEATLLSDYVFRFLQSKQDWINTELRQGAAQPHVYASDIAEIEIPIPPREEQQRIVEVLDEAFAAIATATGNAEKNLASAHALLHSILSRVLHDVAGEWESRELQSLLIDNRKISYGIVKPGRHDPQGVRLIKSQQVRDDSMDLSADFRITRALDKEYARTRLQGGEILLNLVGASIGRSAIAPDELRGANVSRAIAVIPVRTELAPWVQYNLRASVGQEIIRSKTGGAAQPVLNLSEVKRLPIPIPPLDKQEAMVRRLDALSSETWRLARSYRGKIAALGALKKSLMHRAFAGELTERELVAA